MSAPLFARWLATLVIAGVVVATPRGAGQATGPATLVLRNGHFVTVDAAQPTAEAVAVRGDTIVAVGSNADVARLIGSGTEVIDLGGKFGMPGFIEGHAHFMGVGRARVNLNLMKVKNWDEVVSMVADAVQKARPGDWIVGRGWHQEKWNKAPAPSVEGFPVHDSLSQVSPQNPVLLTHASGHASFANARAMELSGITRDTPNPRGGEILKDASGRPIGIFRETADNAIEAKLDEWRKQRSPAELEAEARREITMAAEEALSKGVTSFQDAGSSFETIDLFKKVVDEKKLPIRLWVMIRANPQLLAQKATAYRMINYGDKRLTVRAIKLTLDGALGSRGAWMLDPYADLPSSTGLNTSPVEVAIETARIAMRSDFQYCMHAIGDRANREALNIFEDVFKANPGKTDLRWRIEHAQHISAADIPRFGKLGVIASMQGIHATSDAPFVGPRLGAKRAEEGAYVWQKLMKSGAIVTNGTDAPVEDIDPIASYHATVTRVTNDGSVFFGDQKMTRMEALKSYTWAPAYAGFEENIKGTLTAGKLADITVLTKDITTVPDADILSAKVALTIVGGKIVYRGAGVGSE